MLIELHIRNFALIDSIDLEFYNGLNILTGETGAGKSIIIDSVNFILGNKQTRDIIRIGQNSAYAEAIFDINNNDGIIEVLSENGLEPDDVLVVSREINASGRSISRINGRTVTIGILKRIGELLIDIHGQHEHQSLLDEESHIKILDSFCKGNFSEDKNNYTVLYYRIKDLDKNLEKLKSDEQMKLRRMDLLTFQIQEISEAKLKQGEDEELKKRKEILINSERIFNVLNTSYQNLYESEEKTSAYDEIGISVSSLSSIEKYDDKLRDINLALGEIYYKLEDVINDIRSYKDIIEYNEQELDEIEARLDCINRLKRKYGNTIEEILKYHEEICLELNQIEKSEELIENYTIERDKCIKEIEKLADSLTKIRKSTAENLKELIQNDLKYLGMTKAIFEIEIKNIEGLREDGANTVSFYISTNPGEPPKPLTKVASGGEMSRIMLAIKSVIADIDRIPTLIFDEIDIGISGRTAQAVAEKMSLISRKHQLLCVTHLPQIAAMADTHFKIEKNVKDDKTSTIVYKLDETLQYEELARMLGGAVVTELTREHSKEMIKLANITKNNIK